MIYTAYEDLKDKYMEAQMLCDEILTEKQALFAMTQPSSIDYGRDRVEGGRQSNPMETYMIRKEKAQIEQRLSEAKTILKDRYELLKVKERELRESKHIYDKIYRMRYLDRLRVYRIARKVNYSESQVYRILQDIEDNLRENARKGAVQ